MLLLFSPAAAFVYSSKQNFYFPHTPRYGVHTYLRRRQFFFHAKRGREENNSGKKKGGEGRGGGRGKCIMGTAQPSPLPRNSSSEDRLSHLLFSPCLQALASTAAALLTHTHTHADSKHARPPSSIANLSEDQMFSCPITFCIFFIFYFIFNFLYIFPLFYFILFTFYKDSSLICNSPSSQVTYASFTKQSYLIFIPSFFFCFSLTITPHEITLLLGIC